MSQEPPREAGYYWWAESEAASWEVVRVLLDQATEGDFLVMRLGINRFIPLQEMGGLWWPTSIPKPSD